MSAIYLRKVEGIKNLSLFTTEDGFYCSCVGKIQKRPPCHVTGESKAGSEALFDKGRGKKERRGEKYLATFSGDDSEGKRRGSKGATLL